MGTTGEAKLNFGVSGGKARQGRIKGSISFTVLVVEFLRVPRVHNGFRGGGGGWGGGILDLSSQILYQAGQAPGHNHIHKTHPTSITAKQAKGRDSRAIKSNHHSKQQALAQQPHT